MVKTLTLLLLNIEEKKITLETGNIRQTHTNTHTKNKHTHTHTHTHYHASLNSQKVMVYYLAGKIKTIIKRMQFQNFHDIQ